MDPSERLWQKFIASESTFKPSKRALLEWAKDRAYYAVWMLHFDSDQLKNEIQDINQDLCRYIQIHPVTKPHITLFAAGFPTDIPRYNDDISFDKLNRQFKTLEDLKLSSFSIQVHSITSLLTGPALSIRDPQNAIQKIRQALSEQSTEIRFSPYTPHITTGHYLEERRPQELIHAFHALKTLETLHLKCSKIELTRFSAKALSKNIALCPEDYHSLRTINLKSALKPIMHKK